MYYPGRCPGLVCIALSGQKNAPFFRMRPAENKFLKAYSTNGGANL